MFRIRTIAILVLSVIIILLAVSYVTLLVQQQMQHHQELIHLEKKSATILMDSFVEELDRKYLSRMQSVIAVNQEVVNAFAQYDREKLRLVSKPVYASLTQENPCMTQMAFFLPDNTAFLRVHKPDKFGDDLTKIKPMLVEVGKHKQPLSGFEVGRMGLYFHIAEPVFFEDDFVGTLMLGVHVEQFLAQVLEKVQLNSAVVLKNNAAEKITLHNRQHFNLGDSALYPGQDVFFMQQGSKIVPGGEEQLIHFDDRVTLVFPAIVLQDVHKQAFGSILVAVDITETQRSHHRMIVKVILWTLFLLTAGCLALYFTFTGLLNKIIGLNYSLEEKNQELEQAGEHMERTVQERTRELALANENLRKEMDRRKSSEASLRISVEEWQRTFDAIRNPVLILDPKLTIVKGNAAALELLTQKTETLEIVGRKCHELFAGSDRLCRVCPAKKAIEKRKTHNLVIEHSFLGKVFQVSCVPILEGDELMGYVHTARDITLQRDLEQKLVQAQKMEAMATLAGGIAHDFNNILGAILGNADLLLYRFPRGENDAAPVLGEPPTAEEITEHVTAIKRAGIRAKDLVSQILDFSRQTISKRKIIVITPIIKEGIKLLRSSLPTTIEIKSEVSSNIGPIDIDPTQIHQVLMNLATNAAQALGDTPGRMTISLQEIEAGPDECSRYHDLIPGQYVVLTVSDTGHGIPEHLLERIFDPFFTTRDVGEGTGMGLAVIHGIVISHGGFIDVTSQEGEGTVFTLFFPKVDNEQECETDVVTNMPQGSETILFVDDEEDIVKMRSRMLEYLGYKVFSAGSAAEALDIFRQQNGTIDLVITDQTMPKMTGLMLAEEISKLDNKIPIILCSGYSEAVTTDEANRVGIRRFLAKPLDMRQLSVAIRELLPTGGG